MRNAVKSTDRHWPGGRIPYTISAVFNAQARGLIASAIAEYQTHTCVRFEAKAEGDDHYVHIIKDQGCYSEVGRGSGRQVLSLGDGCLFKGIIMHELMHAVGFFHEQSRTDRDDHVFIVWKNIIDGADGQFQKYSERTIEDLGESYDYGSIMHYSRTAFSKNGEDTIIPKNKEAEIGQRKKFSDVDVRKLNIINKCDVAGVAGTQPTVATGVVQTVAPAPARKGCNDKRPDCKLLYHACKSDATVQQNCAETCGFCGNTDRGECQGDDNTKCATWAKKGYCDRGYLQSFMKQHCCASCGLLKENDSASEE